MSSTVSGALDETLTTAATPARPTPDRRIEEAAHEIRTPLGGLLALADLLLAEDLTETARGHANALKNAAEHLLGVTATLLGGGVRAETALDLARFLDRVASPLAARAATQGVEFAALPGPGLPERVLADEAALRQIVDNLADNALRATASGRVELLLDRIGEDADTVLLRIAVRDTGPGLGDQPERLFSRYVQGAGARGAAGIGLSVVARLAAGMGGRVEASNRPEGGAEVAAIVRLDLDGWVGRMPGSALKVLVAEDHPVNQRVIATLLDQFGHAYDIVPDGAAAVDAVRSGAYDIVLMDAVMPGIDGLAASRAIRMLPGPAGAVRIVGATARAFEHEIAAFLAAGADAVVTKPISVTELWRALSAAEDELKVG